MMQEYDPEDLMFLLAHVVTADNKIFQEEIDAFIKAGQVLEIRSNAGNKMGRKALYNWFDAHHEQVRASTEENDYYQEFVTLFRKLRPMEKKQDVLDYMCSIARADGHFHINEKLLIALAAGHWGMRAPIWSDAG